MFLTIKSPTIAAVFFCRLFFLVLSAECLSLFSVLLLLKLSLWVTLFLFSSLLKVLLVKLLFCLFARELLLLGCYYIVIIRVILYCINNLLVGCYYVVINTLFLTVKNLEPEKPGS